MLPFLIFGVVAGYVSARHGWRVFMAVCVMLPLLALVYAPVCRADWHIGHDGVYHAAPHHWWTNDGHRFELSHGSSGDSELSRPAHEDDHHERRNDGAIHVWSPHMDMYEPWVVNRPHLRKACDGYHLLYVLRHGTNTPSNLHAVHGCRKWMDDAIYHSEKRDPLLPTAAGLLLDVESTAQ